MFLKYSFEIIFKISIIKISINTATYTNADVSISYASRVISVKKERIYEVNNKIQNQSQNVIEFKH